MLVFFFVVLVVLFVFRSFGNPLAELADALTEFSADSGNTAYTKNQKDDYQDDDEFSGTQVRHCSITPLANPEYLRDRLLINIRIIAQNETAHNSFFKIFLGFDTLARFDHAC